MSILKEEPFLQEHFGYYVDMLQVCRDQLMRLNTAMQAELGTVYEDTAAMQTELGTARRAPRSEAFTEGMNQVVWYLRSDFREFYQETPAPAMANTGADADTVMEGVTYQLQLAVII